MRGALQVLHPAPVDVGIIPAYAGSTHPTDRIRADKEDHPRVCGEHVYYQKENTNG